MKYQKRILYIGILLLTAFITAFFLCDSFKNTNHVTEHKHEDATHHQSMVLAIAPNSADVSALQAISASLPTFIAGIVGLLVNLQIIILAALLWLVLRIGRLRSYLFLLFCRGILNPKLY